MGSFFFLDQIPDSPQSHLPNNPKPLNRYRHREKGATLRPADDCAWHGGKKTSDAHNATQSYAKGGELTWTYRSHHHHHSRRWRMSSEPVTITCQRKIKRNQAIVTTAIVDRKT